MNSFGSISATLHALQEATSFVQIFGVIGGDIDQQRKLLRSKFNKLALIAHPDHAPPDGKAIAENAFMLLKDFRDRAEKALQNGTYTLTFSAAGTTPATTAKSGVEIIESSRATYRVESKPYRTGDFSSLFRARVVGVDTAVLLKVAREPRSNPLLEKEATLIDRFRKKGSGVMAFLPEITDSFYISGEKGTRYRVAVMPDRPNCLSLAHIRERLGQPFDPLHTGWIMRRVVAQAVAARMIGVVHAAIVPDHVLVDCISRDPCHIGWAHATDRATDERIRTVINRWRDWYPPEVFEKRVPGHRTDLYMVGKTLIWLLNGDVKKNSIPDSIPKEIRSLILSCVVDDYKRRPESGRKFMNELTRVIRDAWGRTYQPLVLPVG